MNEGWLKGHEASGNSRRRSPGGGSSPGPAECGQPAPRRTGLGPEEGEAIPAAPARGGSAASAVHAREKGTGEEGEGACEGGARRPLAGFSHSFTPGSRGMETAPGQAGARG